MLARIVATCVVALGALLGAGAYGQAQSPAPLKVLPPLSAVQWQQDLQVLADEIRKRHQNPFHTVDASTFNNAVAQLDAAIPSMQRHEILAGFMRIAAMVGDGHTRVEPRKDRAFQLPSLPLKLYLFDDGLYVRAAAPQYAGLVGGKVEAIGGVPVDEAIRRAGELASRDNAMGVRLMVPIYLNMPHLLHALKLSQEPTRAGLTIMKAGMRQTVTLAAGDVEPMWPADTDVSLTTPDGWADARAIAQQPLWLQAPLQRYRLIELPQRDAVYAQLNMVADEPGETLAAFGKRIRERAQAIKASAIVLDLRLNQGGNGDLRTGFVRELIRAEDEGRRLFVLTARGTFSASQFILDDLDRLTQAVFIGEPASSKPSSYGDAYRINLPHSGIQMRTSIYWWQAGQNTDPWTWIDIAAPLSFAAYAAGQDPALEAALQYRPAASLDELVVAANRSGGAAGVQRLLAQHLADPALRYSDHATQWIDTALKLDVDSTRELAMLVADAAAAAFATSSDAAVVQASIAKSLGRFDAARAAGERALALNPNSRFARSLVESLPARN